jgi:PAS domain-containing protein
MGKKRKRGIRSIKVNPKYTGAIGKTGSSHITFLKALKAAFIITDSTGIVTYWNRFAEELWLSEEVIGLSIMETTKLRSEPR